ncbi:hypothetical protein HK098_000887 [Nowakowskiella sp. JEL0407]|nr:hypothetical protein HK098_000887 [Nowakowskiella sp. JEL0407]
MSSLINNVSFLHVAGAIVSITASGYLLLWANNAIHIPSSKKQLESAKKNGKVASVLDIPGPIGLPFFGVLLDIFPYIQRKRMDLYTEYLNEKYDGLCRLTGSFYFVCVDDAAIAKRLLTSPDFIRSDVIANASKDVTPYALFVLPSGDLWKKHRKGLQPAFGPTHLKESFDVSLETVDKLLDLWESEFKIGNNTRNVVEDFTMVTGDVIARVAFSIDLGAVKSLEIKTALEFHKHAEKIAETIQGRVGLRFTPFLWGLFGISVRQLKPTTSFLSSMLQKIVEDKKTLVESKQKERLDIADDQWGRDLLDRLLTSNIFTDEEIKSEALGFFLAGHETTATTLTWTIFALVQNPRAYAKLKEEIDQTLKGGKPSNESLSNLKYLDAFFKETQRMHGVVTAIARDSATETTVTTFDGLTIAIPANVQFLINMHRIHKSKLYWGEDANEFKPERWADSFVPIPGTFMPFGDGPMNCIGQKIAVIETKIALTRIIQRFDLRLSPKQEKIEPITTLTYGLKHGLLIEFTARNTN